ncbi:MFS transporter [Paenibacillus tengchongensis]|uniref:MFS transporter n=1 Tax=Paenibacillus tengchongensis TaxID=2608684 RepID=UPI0016520875|nr:MFS transporter [Paenibacillus tengchongensis]
MKMKVTPAKPNYRLLLKLNPDFRFLWMARTFSFFGDSLYNLAISWLVYSMTGSSLQVGLVIVTKFLPEMLLGLFIGAWVDRLNKKLLMQIADAAQAILTGILALLMITGRLELMHIYLITVCLSITGNIFATSQSSWLPELIEDKSYLLTANSLLSVSLQITRIVGTVAGGILVAVIGNSGAVVWDAVTFVISLCLIQFIKKRGKFQREARQDSTSIFTEIREGWGWLKGQTALLFLILLGTLSNIALGPSNVLPPMLVQDRLHGDSTQLGIFNAFIAVGLLLGGLFIGRISPKKVGLWFVCGLGIQGIGMFVIAASPVLWLACAGNLILGLGVTVTVIPMSTLFQLLVPATLRGRVNSITSMAFNVSIPITYGVVGILGDWLGAGLCFGLAAVLFGVCLAIGLSNPQLRSLNLKALQSSAPTQSSLSV